MGTRIITEKSPLLTKRGTNNNDIKEFELTYATIPQGRETLHSTIYNPKTALSKAQQPSLMDNSETSVGGGVIEQKYGKDFKIPELPAQLTQSLLLNETTANIL